MAEVFWLGGKNNNWSDGENWSGGSAPAASDVIYFSRATKFSPEVDLDQKTLDFGQIIATPEYTGGIGFPGKPLICACGWVIWNSPGAFYVDNITAVAAGAIDRLHVSQGFVDIQASASLVDVIITGGRVKVYADFGNSTTNFDMTDGECEWNQLTSSDVITNFNLRGGTCTTKSVEIRNLNLMGGIWRGAPGQLTSVGGGGDHRIVGGVFEVVDRQGAVANSIDVYPGGKIDCTKYTGQGVSGKGTLYFDTIRILGGVVDLRNATSQVTVNTGIMIDGGGDFQLMVDHGQKWTIADQ